MLDRGLRRAFDPAVEREGRLARDAGLQPDEGQAARRDLRDLATFTIDPISAQDFDDAVSAERLTTARRGCSPHRRRQGLRARGLAGRPASAYRRATSVSVPGAAAPMLPEALSSDASARWCPAGPPGRDRRD